MIYTILEVIYKDPITLKNELNSFVANGYRVVSTESKINFKNDLIIIIFLEKQI